jgi:hypothetical protein
VPPEYRDFVLRAACARNAQADGSAADCTAINRLRDEKSYTKEQVALIAANISTDASVAQAEKESRTRNPYACLDVRE